MSTRRKEGCGKKLSFQEECCSPGRRKVWEETFRVRPRKNRVREEAVEKFVS